MSAASVASTCASCPDPDLLVLGSSRALLLDSAMFGSDLSVYNAAMSTASIEDFVAVWEALVESGTTPTRVLLVLDPSMLNRSYRNAAWRANADLVDAFRERTRPASGGLHVAALERAVGAARALNRELGEVLGWPMLRASLSQLLASGGTHDVAFRIVAREQRPPQEPAWRSDGAHVYPDRETRPRPLEELRALALAGALERNFYWIQDFALDAEARHLLDDLVADLRARGAEVLVVVPPYEPYVLEALRRQPSAAHALLTFLEAVAALADSPSGGLPVCTAIEAAEVGCAETDFLDGYHMKRSCAERVVRTCLARTSG